MSFDNMPALGPMMMPGATDYAAECLRLAKAAAPAYRVKMDIPYGSDPFQQLDLWMPHHIPDDQALPVIMFIHGGAMRNGFKEWVGAMAPTICALPAILVSPNYRLVPGVRNVDALADCLDALAWVHRHIGEEGGDPRRLYIGGHSAGGYLAALMTLRKADLALRLPEAAVRGCLAVSGLFTFEKKDILPEDMLRNRFWSQMVASDAEASSVTAYDFVAGNTIPFLMAHGAKEPEDLLHDNARMTELARENGFLYQLVVFPGCDHFAAHMACTDPDGAWIRSVAALIEASGRTAA